MLPAEFDDIMGDSGEEEKGLDLTPGGGVGPLLPPRSSATNRLGAGNEVIEEENESLVSSSKMASKKYSRVDSFSVIANNLAIQQANKRERKESKERSGTLN